MPNATYEKLEHIYSQIRRETHTHQPSTEEIVSIFSKTFRSCVSFKTAELIQIVSSLDVIIGRNREESIRQAMYELRRRGIITTPLSGSTS
jgi:hypothetical protein